MSESIGTSQPSGPTANHNGFSQPPHTRDHYSTSHLYSPPVYSESLVTSFPYLSSSYVSNTVAQSIGNFSRKKLNSQNYFSWSQYVKMILERRYKFGFLIGEIPRPPPGDF